MRPCRHALLALVLTAMPAAAQGVVPSRGVPTPATPGAADRPVVRGTDGSARGFSDQGVTRGTAGGATGFAQPDGAGGAVTRAPDGRRTGAVAPQPRLQSYVPQRR